MFDTTLRDGEQSPGATLTSKEKMEIAKQLSKLGVDIIEAGFPQSSPDDFEAVRSIAMEVGNNVIDGYAPVICGLARCRCDVRGSSWGGVFGGCSPMCGGCRVATAVECWAELCLCSVLCGGGQLVHVARWMVVVVVAGRVYVGCHTTGGSWVCGRAPSAA